MNQLWRIRILGGLIAQNSDRVISRFRTERTRALLAYLAYHRHRAHPRETLIDLLWPDYDLPAGRNCLSIELSSLRHQLEPPGTPRGTVIIADNSSVQLNPLAVTTDVAEFDAALRSASDTVSTIEQVQFLSDAVALYSGPLLPGCYLPGCYENWIKPEQQRLNEDYILALRQLIRHTVKSGEFSRAFDYAHRAISADPLREESYRDLMWLYAINGQPLVAMQLYHELEQLLRQELGTEPTRSTRAMAQRIASGVNSSEPPDLTPIVRTPPAEVSTSLPSGTLTFLIAIVASSEQISQLAASHNSPLANWQNLLQQTCRRCHGHQVRSGPDSLLAAFSGATDALECAVAVQQALATMPQHEAKPSRQLRMALFTGEAKPREGRYSDPLIDYGGRLAAAAYGGQILCAEVTAALLKPHLEVSAALVDLGRYRLHGVSTSERLFQIEYPGMPPHPPMPQNVQPAEVSNLPLQLTRFFGRKHELTRLQYVLLTERKRCLTITGPGGIGKTRLALEAANDLVNAFQGAIWFASLVHLSSAQGILDVIYNVLSLRRTGKVAALEEVIEVLGRQQSLLILDNFEHLIAEGASIVHTLLERVPSLQCLITSRRRLNLSGEHELPILPLPVPQANDPPERQANCASVQLFVDRAQAVRPDFQVTEANAPVIATLCARLEGIPLAIELAASRVQTRAVSSLLDELAHRLDVLVDRRRDTPDRHRSLRAVMDWSYRLLEPELQRFFAQLSIFRGGWTASAAETVCAEPLALDFLAQLLECSQVVAEESGSEMRFFLLDTIREFAREKLSEKDHEGAMGRHASYYLQLAEEAEQHLLGPEALTWFDLLEREHDNLRAALAWCRDTQMVETGLKLAGALWRFWYVRGYHQEGFDWLNCMLAMGKDALIPVRIKALNGAGNIAYDEANYPVARTLLEERLALSREIQDERHIAASLGNLANIANAQADYSLAQDLLEESLTLFIKLGDRRGESLALANLAVASCGRSDYTRARTLHQSSLAMFRESGDRQNIVMALNNLAHTLLAMDDYASVPTLLEESLTLSQALESKRNVIHCLMNYFGLAVKQGEMERAAVLLGAAEHLREQIDFPLPPQAVYEIERDCNTICAVLGAQAFQTARAKGYTITVEQATAYALGQPAPSPDDSESTPER